MRSIGSRTVLFSALVLGGVGSAQDHAPARRAAIVVFDGVELLDAAGPAEVLTHVGMMRRIDERPALEVVLAAPRAGVVRTQNGIRLIADVSLADCTPVDLLVVPGGATASLTDDAAVMDRIRELGREAEIVMSVCNGAFVLARTGVLDGCEVTTHSALTDALQRQFPAVRVVTDVRFVDAGAVLTTAGVSAGIDGALRVVERWYGRALADHVRVFIEWERDGELPQRELPSAPGEAPFAAAIEEMQGAADAERALGWVERALEAGLRMPSRVLVAPALQPLRNSAEHRVRLTRLLRDHARESEATIVTADEPGERLRLSLAVVDPDGAPVAGALLFVYQADHAGRYAPEASEPGDGNRSPRLFAWLRTDSRGRAALATVLPGGYAGAPPHFHVAIAPGGTADGPRTGGSLYLDGGWPMDDEIHADARAGHAWIAPVERREDGALSVAATLRLRGER